jgi:hypothetical protein
MGGGGSGLRAERMTWLMMAAARAGSAPQDRDHW